MFGSERLKTEEEKLKEEKEKLERLEADRLRRMRGDLEDATRGAAISVEDMQVGSLSPG
jgi:nucleolar protein 14